MRQNKATPRSVEIRVDGAKYLPTWDAARLLEISEVRLRQLVAQNIIAPIRWHALALFRWSDLQKLAAQRARE